MTKIQDAIIFCLASKRKGGLITKSTRTTFAIFYSDIVP